MEKIKIFSAYYKQYYIPKSPIFCPIHVGHINSQNELGLLADDTGDNISSKNLTFNEVTAQYWVWKNYKEAEFVGFCHYRRYLIYPSENNIYSKTSRWNNIRNRIHSKFVKRAIRFNNISCKIIIYIIIITTDNKISFIF